jgi:hypothetical protein
LSTGDRMPLAIPAGTLAWTDAATIVPWSIASTIPTPRTWWLSFDDRGAA